MSLCWFVGRSLGLLPRRSVTDGTLILCASLLALSKKSEIPANTTRYYVGMVYLPNIIPLYRLVIVMLLF